MTRVAELHVPGTLHNNRVETIATQITWASDIYTYPFLSTLFCVSSIYFFQCFPLSIRHLVSLQPKQSQSREVSPERRSLLALFLLAPSTPWKCPLLGQQ